MEPSHSTQKKYPQKKLSSDEWRDIWYRKSKRILKEQFALSEIREFYLEHISEYLEHTNDNPYYIPIEDTESFIKENELKPLPILQFFYKHIAPSDKQIKAILQFQDKSKKKQDKYIRSLKIEMKVHNFTFPTIKNYLNIINQYFNC